MLLWLLTLALAGVSLLFLALTPEPFRKVGFLGLPDQVGLLFPLLAYGSIGAFVASRRPDHPIGWLFVAVGFFISLGSVTLGYATYGLLVAPGSLPLALLVAWIWQWSFAGVALVFTWVPLLYPTGRLPSGRWWPAAWIASVSLATMTLALAFAPGPVFLNAATNFVVGNPFGIEPLAWFLVPVREQFILVLLPAIVVSTAALIDRLIHARGEEAQQLKWFVYTAAITGTCFVVAFTVPGAWNLAISAGGLAMLAMPIATGLAILRYGLYDIDLLINRTLVYGALTAVVAGLYAALTMLLQRVSVAGTGQTSDVTLVLAALVAAVVFTPLKNRLQTLVDRHFKPSSEPGKEPEAVQVAIAELRDEVAYLRAELATMRQDRGVEPSPLPPHTGSQAAQFENANEAASG